ncbi:helix-turn-helix domain-containing protein [Streptomyces roseoverticillatus]|uniref:helix-turn-helix domain-containing protein n=1 Tax=Streptomyces roseoverticillatus TaxID=66429 RepID=UPI001F36648D|nr:helix-turn-helix transcriptional regulator [Streptomyces roseoverticillatus]MCF3103820.1 helix-turn-helix domain-containing protein [Streptomyces roseoverticillatus]
MARRTIVTARQERLGAELRKLRERAGVSARDAAAAVGRDQAWLSHMEAGNVAVGAERTRLLAARYEVEDAALVDALAERAAERSRGWWEKYRGRMRSQALDLAELEWHASALRSVQIVNVPGLLQTEDYVRSLFAYVADELDAYDVDTIVAFRLQRREVLERDNPPAFTAIVHEAALRMKVGDRKVAREQLDSLLAASDRPGVTIRAVPFEAERFAGMGHSMLYAADRVAILDTVQADHVHGSAFFYGEDQLAKYSNRWRKAEGSALGPRETRDFIQRIAHEL